MKMTEECAVVQDLMVLYEDDVCSEESRKIIETHIETCEACRTVYENMQQELPKIHLEDQEEKAFVTFAKKCNQKIHLTYMMLIAVVLLVILAGDYIWSDYIREWVAAVPSNEVTVEELYRLKTGDLYCVLKTEKPFAHLRQEAMYISGNPDKNHEDGWYEMHFQYLFPWEKGTNNTYYETYQGEIAVIFPMHTKSPVGSGQYKCARVSYVGSGKSDVLTIWEKGQELSDAPEDIQKYAAKIYLNENAYASALKQGMTDKEIREVLEEAQQQEGYQPSFPIYMRNSL